MINVHKDSAADFSDNDRYDDLDFTTGLREYKPHAKRPMDYRTLAVMVIGALITQLVILVLYHVWKLIYCWNDHYGTCAKVDAVEPWLMGFILLAGPILAISYIGLTLYSRFCIDRAIARRTGMVLDRYGDNIPTRFLERQESDFYERRYMIATRLQREIAPYQIYKGVNTLSNTNHSAPLAPEDMVSDLMPRDTWFGAVNEMPHLLIYGPSKAGKSTLAQAVAALMEAEYIVIDPLPNKPTERKWGGIDFIRLDQAGDEYATIRAALQAIQNEDAERRRTMDTQHHKPLVVIIDEVLGLVSGLGAIKVNGKTEPIMAHFIRTMGYSARHRNIKIILIGQGKNLIDLGLDSATARNNYALIRAARNPATNERSAAIVTDEGEQPIDIADVLRLSQSIGTQAKVWKTHLTLSHNNMQMQPIAETINRDDRAVELFQAGKTIRDVGNILRSEGFTIGNGDLQELKRKARDEDDAR